MAVGPVPRSRFFWWGGGSWVVDVATRSRARWRGGGPCSTASALGRPPLCWRAALLAYPRAARRWRVPGAAPIGVAAECRGTRRVSTGAVLSVGCEGAARPVEAAAGTWGGGCAAARRGVGRGRGAEVLGGGGEPRRGGSAASAKGDAGGTGPPVTGGGGQPASRGGARGGGVGRLGGGAGGGRARAHWPRSSGDAGRGLPSGHQECAQGVWARRKPGARGRGAAGTRGGVNSMRGAAFSLGGGDGATLPPCY